MSGSFNPLDHPVCAGRPLYIAPSAWIMHVPFAMFLMDAVRPRVFVELGTFYGVSYCAFCQAASELETQTRCYAVDTWRGDAHAGFIGDDVLGGLKEHHDPLYGGFSKLLRMTFEAAAAQFADGSVDLLHIDGFHTYEAVRQDFETWLPRMSERGVMLFHDIAERGRDFGVWQLWEELKTRYPHYEVEFGHGLGVIAVGREYPPSLEALFRPASGELERIREYFRRLGEWAASAQQADADRRETQAREAAAAARAERMRREHPLLVRASNLFQVWAEQGLGGAVGLTLSKVGAAGASGPEKGRAAVAPSSDA